MSLSNVSHCLVFFKRLYENLCYIHYDAARRSYVIIYIASNVWVCELCIGIHSIKIYLGSLLIVNNPLQTKTAYLI